MLEEKHCSFLSVILSALVTCLVIQSRFFNHDCALRECVSLHLGAVQSPGPLTHSARTLLLHSAFGPSEIFLRPLFHFFYNNNESPAETECLTQNWDQDIFLQYLNQTARTDSQNLQYLKKYHFSFSKCGRCFTLLSTRVAHWFYALGSSFEGQGFKMPLLGPRARRLTSLLQAYLIMANPAL